jgi:prevent-host-death family protein
LGKLIGSESSPKQTLKNYPTQKEAIKCILDISYAIAYLLLKKVETMTILNATEARTKLYKLIDQAANTHQPIIITGKRKNAVLISEEDWNAITETLHLLSIPGMRESIKEGLNQDLSECSRELDW